MRCDLVKARNAYNREARTRSREYGTSNFSFSFPPLSLSLLRTYNYKTLITRWIHAPLRRKVRLSRELCGEHFRWSGCDFISLKIHQWKHIHFNEIEKKQSRTINNTITIITIQLQTIIYKKKVDNYLILYRKFKKYVFNNISSYIENLCATLNITI